MFVDLKYYIFNNSLRGDFMVSLNVDNILKSKGKSRYWLFNELNILKPMSYTNFLNLIDSRTQSIKYIYIERLCEILECTPNELFLITKE